MGGKGGGDSAVQTPTYRLSHGNVMYNVGNVVSDTIITVCGGR